MIIELQNGTRFDIAEYGLKRLFHYIPSLVLSHNTKTVEDRGDIVISSAYKQRTITVTLLYKVGDIYDYYLLRDQLNALFARNEAFYIIFKREHWKRYKVRLASQLSMNPAIRMDSFNVEFLMEDKYAESVGSSLDLQIKGSWDESLWGFGSGIDYDTQYNYTFNTNSFVVKNIGNELVDPRESKFDITLKGTFSNQVKITNQTTGDVFIYTGTLSSTDELRLIGIRTLKNGVSALKNTNKRLLTLLPGDNSFTVEGGTVSSIVFNFNFLYK